MVKVKIVVRNSHFVITLFDTRLSHVMSTVDRKLVTHTLRYDHRAKRMIKERDKLYYVHNKHTGEYRLPISILKDVVLSLGNSGVDKSEMEISYDKRYKVSPLLIDWNEEFTPREYQERYKAALVREDNQSMKLIDLATGYGKSLIATNAILEINMKTMILVLPKYIEKWVDDVMKYSDADESEIFTVKGGDSLNKLLEIDKDNDFKFIIVSIRTMMLYIKNYEASPFDTKVVPEDLLKILKIGTLLNDESHQETHAVFKSLLYLNPIRTIGLSATFDSNQKDKKYIYHVMFPGAARVSNLVEYKPYINVYAVRYRIGDSRRLQYKRPQGYSHIMFEQSVLRNSVMLDAYIKLIDTYVTEGYIDRKEKGDKCLIFAASISMCTVLTNYFLEKYSELNIHRYVEDDPYENLMTGDVVISTVISAGTAVDIKGLITTIQTISISSLQMNLQSMGRLREKKGKEMRYYYIYSADIPNQVKMHNDRYMATQAKTAEYNYLNYDELLPVR